MLLTIENLGVEYSSERGKVKALEGVNLQVNKGEFISIVGESGCGKSTLAYSIIRLCPGKIVSGQILFEGRNLVDLSEKELRKIRGKEISMIFQDPMTSLDPLEKIGSQIVETIRAHEKVDKKTALLRAKKLLKSVGLPEDRIFYYPHQLSGGQRQRVMIAISIALNPKLLIADEPTTALDVIVQQKILDILVELKKQGMSIILITHDLALAIERSDFVTVMYAGWVVEFGRAKEIIENPLHPYTQALLNSIPDLWVDKPIKPLKGSPPDLANLPKGCRFHLRCEKAMSKCREHTPPSIKIGKRIVKCFLYEGRNN